MRKEAKGKERREAEEAKEDLAGSVAGPTFSANVRMVPYLPEARQVRRLRRGAPGDLARTRARLRSSGDR